MYVMHVKQVMCVMYDMDVKHKMYIVRNVCNVNACMHACLYGWTQNVGTHTCTHPLTQACRHARMPEPRTYVRMCVRVYRLDVRIYSVCMYVCMYAWSNQ